MPTRSHLLLKVLRSHIQSRRMTQWRKRSTLADAADAKRSLGDGFGELMPMLNLGLDIQIPAHAPSSVSAHLAELSAAWARAQDEVLCTELSAAWAEIFPAGEGGVAAAGAGGESAGQAAGVTAAEHIAADAPAQHHDPTQPRAPLPVLAPVLFALGIKEDEMASFSATSDLLDLDVRVLLGDYVERGTNHGRMFYQKMQQIESSEDVEVFLYYWNALDGWSDGWWFGDQVGGEHVWAHCHLHTRTPPHIGWKIPWNAAEPEMGRLIVGPYMVW